jgi:hypothetical protein
MRSRTDLSIPAGDAFFVRVEVAEAFCKVFSIADAIERFVLPYVRVAGERWAYTAGARMIMLAKKTPELGFWCPGMAMPVGWQPDDPVPNSTLSE